MVSEQGRVGRRAVSWSHLDVAEMLLGGAAAGGAVVGVSCCWGAAWIKPQFMVYFKEEEALGWGNAWVLSSGASQGHTISLPHVPRSTDALMGLGKARCQ